MVNPQRERSIGALGGRAIGLILGMLVVGGLITVVLTQPALDFYLVPPELAPSLRMEAIPQQFMDAANSGGVGLGEWLKGLIPANPINAAANGDILQLLVFTILVGAAVGHLPQARRAPLSDLFQSLADAMLVYPFTAALGRISLRGSARASRPAQLIALGTQSSLASLPAMVEGGRREMGLPSDATGFVLPLCVSTFKMNQAVSPTSKFLLAAHVFGVQLDLMDLTTFVVGTALLSFSVVGVPRGGGGFRTLPLYLALGVPIEGYIVFEAVKYIPDMLMTLLNVTADMSVATILSRDSRQKAVATATNQVATRPSTNSGVRATSPL